MGILDFFKKRSGLPKDIADVFKQMSRQNA